MPKVIFYVNILSIDPSTAKMYSHKAFTSLDRAITRGLTGYAFMYSKENYCFFVH